MGSKFHPIDQCCYACCKFLDTQLHCCVYCGKHTVMVSRIHPECEGPAMSEWYDYSSPHS